jgi:3-oxoacyl-[acyl-carrier protein] reductase
VPVDAASTRSRPDLSLEGRTAVVTGATRGIGRAVARALAAAGARVVLVGRSTEDRPNSTLPGTLEAAVAGLREAGAEVMAIQADMGSPEDTQRVIDETIDAYGGCDLLVNNAAFMPSGPVLSSPSHRWSNVLRINAVAPLQLCQGFVPGMLDRGFGRVLNVSSGASVAAPPDLFFYGASKACLDRLTLALDAEAGGRGVTFNSVQVGAVATEQFRYSAGAGILERQGTGIAEAPFDPADVADAFVWLLRQPDGFSGQVVTFPDLVDLGALRLPTGTS